MSETERQLEAVQATLITAEHVAWTEQPEVVARAICELQDGVDRILKAIRA